MVAVLLSVGGIMIGLKTGIPGISGFGTVGEVNVSITEQISLNLTYPAISFGTGYVSGGYDDAKLSSIDGTTHGWTESSGFTAGGIVIQNIGNTDLNVTFSLLENTSDFVGGTDPQFYWRGVNNETNSCDPTNGRLVTSWPAIPDANWNSSICENLTSQGNADTIDFHVNLTIPADAKGTKGVVITFEGSLPT